MRVLGIETSCDETAAGVVSEGGLLSDVIHTQAVHEAYGGVVPELASRAHAERVVPVVRAAIERAGGTRPQMVAATAGPGLVGAVLVGLSFGRALAAAWQVPFHPVNHLEGHLLSPLLHEPSIRFPFLGLVVSGGHSALYRAESVGRCTHLGGTVDDAAGEAFDKVARLLDLGYPGGPAIDRLARTGDPEAIAFPRPRAPDLHMSFSGLKTAVRAWVESHPDTPPPDLAASFQEAVVDVLVDRVERALDRHGLERAVVSGGVAANARLRKRLAAIGAELHIPPIRYCTDNGSMIAHVARQHRQHGISPPTGANRARPVWELGAL